MSEQLDRIEEDRKRVDAFEALAHPAAPPREPDPGFREIRLTTDEPAPIDDAGTDDTIWNDLEELDVNGPEAFDPESPASHDAKKASAP